MAAAKVDLIIEQGATFDVEVIWYDNTGTPVDISGYTARMKVKESITSDTSLLYLTSDLNADGTGLNLSGSVTANGYPKPLTSGSIGIYVSAASSSLLDFNNAVYDLELESSTGFVNRVIKGKITLDKEVTD